MLIDHSTIETELADGETNEIDGGSMEPPTAIFKWSTIETPERFERALNPTRTDPCSTLLAEPGGTWRKKAWYHYRKYSRPPRTNQPRSIFGFWAALLVFGALQYIWTAAATVDQASSRPHRDMKPRASTSPVQYGTSAVVLFLGL